MNSTDATSFTSANLFDLILIFLSPKPFPSKKSLS